MDPKTFKKHSQIAQRLASNIVVVGKKEKTTTGYRIPGHSCGSFETYFEALLPGTSSDLIKHPKKDRVVRVLTGGGFVVLDDGKNPSVDKKIHPGDEVVLKAGTSYRFATTADQGLELNVTQAAKYEARMEVLEESGATTEVSDEQLVEAERSLQSTQNHRKGSKAKQQQARKNSKRVASGQVFAVDQETTKVDHGSAAAAIMNARPSMGRFDEDGAG